MKKIVIGTIVGISALFFVGCEPQPTNDNAYLCLTMNNEDAKAAGISCPEKNAPKTDEKKNDNGVICFFETKDCKK